MSVDDWTDLIEELTPSLRLSEQVTAYWDDDVIVVDWYGYPLTVYPEDVLARGGDPIDSLRRLLNQTAPLTPGEVTHENGYLGYGRYGWNVHVTRDGRCVTSEWQPRVFDKARFRVLTPDDYKVTMNGALLVIDSEDMCPCSILSGGPELIGAVLADHYHMDENTRALTIMRGRTPVIIGHQKLLTRMSAEMDYEHAILNPHDLQLPGSQL